MLSPCSRLLQVQVPLAYDENEGGVKSNSQQPACVMMGRILAAQSRGWGPSLLHPCIACAHLTSTAMALTAALVHSLTNSSSHQRWGKFTPRTCAPCCWDLSALLSRPAKLTMAHCRARVQGQAWANTAPRGQPLPAALCCGTGYHCSEVRQATTGCATYRLSLPIGAKDAQSMTR